MHEWHRKCYCSVRMPTHLNGWPFSHSITNAKCEKMMSNEKEKKPFCSDSVAEFVAKNKTNDLILNRSEMTLIWIESWLKWIFAAKIVIA